LPHESLRAITAVQQSAAKLWDAQPGLAAYKVGVPYQDKACPLGVLVPCVLTNHDGSQFEVTLIVRFRQTDGRRTCVVVYTWGQAKSLD
jgi:hypothetical protein